MALHYIFVFFLILQVHISHWICVKFRVLSLGWGWGIGSDTLAPTGYNNCGDYDNDVY